MRTLLTALLMAIPVLGCDCTSVASACSGLSGTAVVFVGRVLPDSEPTRVIVEERLLNVAKEAQELEIDTSGCPLESDEKYVIFARRDEDGNLVVAPCLETFK